jgi:hypothetical protein
VPKKAPNWAILAREAAREAGDLVYQGQPCLHRHDGQRRVKDNRCVACAATYDPKKSLNKTYQAAREAAREAGEVRYVGKPCIRGHSGERWVKDSSCIECHQEDMHVGDALRKSRKRRRIENPEYAMWEQAKYRATSDILRRGREPLDFDIEVSDIVIPTHCPILGIELSWKEGGPRAPWKPSLDRIDSSKGYVKGNVQVISYRANVLKRDMTLEEAQLFGANLAAYMQRSLATQSESPVQLRLVA